MIYSIDQGWDQSSDHLFCLDGLNCPTTIKDRVSRILSDVLGDPTFIEVLTDDDKKVGTHSIRKYAATYARRCGCSKDEVDYRFRWKNQRMQDDTLKATLQSMMPRLLLLSARVKPSCTTSRWKAIYPTPGS